MSEFVFNSTAFGVVLTIITYQIGMYMKKKWQHPLANPLLISVIISIVFLAVFRIEFETYNRSARYLSYLLTPATVCLAIPLYQQIQLLKKNFKAIIIGTVAGVLSSMGSVYALALLFQFTYEQYVTLLPKSITSAIAIGLMEEHGGIVTITIAVIILTGIFGNIIAEKVCKWSRITNPVAKGLAIGSAAHIMGTVKAMEMGEVEGAMSSLAIITSGLTTVVAITFFVGIW